MQKMSEHPRIWVGVVLERNFIPFSLHLYETERKDSFPRRVSNEDESLAKWARQGKGASAASRHVGHDHVHLSATQ